MNERIKKLREIMGMSQAEFALMLGDKEQRIRNIESGRQKVHLDTIINVVQKMNVDAYWILTGNGNVFYKKSANASPELPKKQQLVKGQREARLCGFIDYWMAEMSDDDQAWLEIQIKRCIPEYAEFLSDKAVGEKLQRRQGGG